MFLGQRPSGEWSFQSSRYTSKSGVCLYQESDVLEVELFAWALTDAKTVDEIRLNLEKVGTFSEKELSDIPALGLTSLIGRYTFDSTQELVVLIGDVDQS